MAENTAVSVGADYFAAWTSKDSEAATSYLADDVEILSSSGNFVGQAGWHEFMDGFIGMLTNVSDLTIFGDDTTAVLYYTSHLAPVPNLTTGERITLREGKIARLELTFDVTPFAALQANQ